MHKTNSIAVSSEKVKKPRGAPRKTDKPNNNKLINENQDNNIEYSENNSANNIMNDDNEDSRSEGSNLFTSHRNSSTMNMSIPTPTHMDEDTYSQSDASDDSTAIIFEGFDD